MTSQDFVNSATEAQMELHAAVRRGEWPDPGEDIIDRPTPIWRYVTLACLVAFAGWILMGMAARAAERERPVPHDLWLLVKPVSDRPNIFRIGTGYADKVTCEKAKRRLVIKVSGTLQCHPFNVGE